VSTFQDFVTARYSEVNNQNTRALPFLKDATVRQLKELSGFHTRFMEAQLSFNLTAQQESYGAGYPGFPVDVMEITTLYVEVGDPPIRYEIKGPVGIAELRFERYPTAIGFAVPHPRRWAWHAEQVWFYPRPGAVVTVKGDYFRDATRDTVTGNVITATDTTSTNPWFSRGENFLRCAVLAEYHMSISGDDSQAARYGAQAEAAKASLRKEFILAKGSSFQAPTYGFGEDY